MSLQKNNKKKTVVICNFPRFSGEIWMPYLWASAKTYYELYGLRKDEWTWAPCYADVYSSDYKDKIKESLLEAQPNVFAISLYVWNYTLAHEIAAWVKTTWPECIVVSGGPHQYFKHDLNWFKEHWYLDASLPGDCYGELCFKEILDNYDTSMDWNTVTDARYPSSGRNILSSKISMSHADKRQFQYDWSALHSQFDLLNEFVIYQRKQFPKSMLLCVLETTRGCPYGCTYCDWGGGTATTVIKKSIENVKLDIDAVAQFDLTFLYFADANFGIFGDRDVDIVKYLVKRKKETGQMFKIGYGGFAKTENRLNSIREILKVDIDNSLSLTKELKLSLQSLDEQVLENIDRVNVNLDKQLEVFEPLARDKQMPLYVEMIMGLPGISLTKYYYELDKLGEHDLSVQWFEWILLPETPAYALAYRQQYGIETIVKNKGWAVKEEDSDREVVVGGTGFNKDDYLQMLLSNSLYHLFVQGGFYQNSLDWIRITHGIGHGVIVQDVYENFFLKSKYSTGVKQRWEQIISDPDLHCAFHVDGEEVYGGWYFVALAFLNLEFTQELVDWLQKRNKIPNKFIKQDRRVTINKENFNKIKLQGLSILDYRKHGGFRDNSIHSLIGLFINHHDTGRVFQGKRRLFGLVTI